jgi:hypothetical protein
MRKALSVFQLKEGNPELSTRMVKFLNLSVCLIYSINMVTTWIAQVTRPPWNSRWIPLQILLCVLSGLKQMHKQKLLNDGQLRKLSHGNVVALQTESCACYVTNSVHETRLCRGSSLLTWRSLRRTTDYLRSSSPSLCINQRHKRATCGTPWFETLVLRVWAMFMTQKPTYKNLTCM